MLAMSKNIIASSSSYSSVDTDVDVSTHCYTETSGISLPSPLDGFIQWGIMVRSHVDATESVSGMPYHSKRYYEDMSE